MATSRTSAWPSSTLVHGIHSIIGLSFNEREHMADKIFNVYDSNQLREQTLTAGGIGTFDEKVEGTDLVYKAMNEGFLGSSTYVEYANGFRITRKMYINDLYDTMEKHAKELGAAAAATRETVAADILNNGFDSTFTGPDGQQLFDTDHVREDGVTYQNKPTTDSDLSQTSLEQGCIDFADMFKTGGGRRLQLRPRRLITARAGIFDGWRLLDSDKDPGTDINAINPLSRLNLEHVVWDYMDDSDAWFLQADEHDLRLYDREDFWSDHIIDFESKDVKISGMLAFHCTWGDPRGIYGNQGS